MTRFVDTTPAVQRVRAAAFALCVVILFLQNAVAQDTVRIAEPKTVVVASDTGTVVHRSKVAKKLRRHAGTATRVEINNGTEKAVLTVDDTTTVAATPQHSPTKALWMSAVLPGLGQVYNRQAWKIPIIYAGAAAVTYFAVTNYQGRERFKKEYINRQNGNTDALLERYANYPDANIYSLYQSYNRNFQLSLIVGGVVYALNLLDAYVYGHLFDFEITDDVSMSIRPNVEYFSMPGFSTPATGLTLQVRF